MCCSTWSFLGEQKASDVTCCIRGSSTRRFRDTWKVSSVPFSRRFRASSRGRFSRRPKKARKRRFSAPSMNPSITSPDDITPTAPKWNCAMATWRSPAHYGTSPNVKLDSPEDKRRRGNNRGRLNFQRPFPYRQYKNNRIPRNILNKSNQSP